MPENVLQRGALISDGANQRKDITMNIYVRSMIAGFAATIVLSVLMIMKAAMGVMPQLDVISMLSEMS
ncbi:hypothetical protein [Mesorhizobium sp. 1M-11]|uniref:hypothetical protein n=1 Tax=Mesorhizobium sp. 1M-11 TaxID=1529006 RepID=UPI000AB3CED9|nr:hypothetical protein [Mesorhizobium sp. 1M-11]